VDIQQRVDYVSVSIAASNAELASLQSDIRDTEGSRQIYIQEGGSLRQYVNGLRDEIASVKALCNETTELVIQNGQSDLEHIEHVAVGEHSEKSPPLSAHKLRALKLELLHSVEAVYDGALQTQTRQLRQQQQIQQAIRVAEEKLYLCKQSILVMDDAINEMQQQHGQVERSLDSISTAFETNMCEMLLTVRLNSLMYYG
jgi:chromosome segregation ATPase